MKYILPALGAAFITGALVSCDESSTIGSSIVQDKVEIVMDSSFTVSGRSITVDRVQSRTITQLIGLINAKGFGELESEVVCQFMPAASLVTEGVTADDIDSLKLVLLTSKTGFVGDSLAPMGLEVFRLNRQLPSPIYSDFNPTDYYDPSAIIGSEIYSTAAIGVSDSLAALDYRSVYVNLPKSLGQELYNKYLSDPSIFSEPSAFAQFFPGIYIKNSYGSGRVLQVVVSEMRMYYRQTLPIEGTDRDSTYNRVSSYFAVTPEVISNNNITLNLAPEITTRAEAGEAIIVAPVGRDVQIEFPTREIVSQYKASSGNMAIINSLSFSIPAEAIANDYSIAPPPYLLMVKSSDKDKFFADNSVTDGSTSFYAAYDATNNCYTFNDMRQYILDMVAKEDISQTDVMFTLTPISVNTESTSSGTTYISEITPYVSTPAIVDLDLEKAKIKFVYSKQTIKN